MVSEALEEESDEFFTGEQEVRLHIIEIIEYLPFFLVYCGELGSPISNAHLFIKINKNELQGLDLQNLKNQSIVFRYDKHGNISYIAIGEHNIRNT